MAMYVTIYSKADDAPGRPADIDDAMRSHFEQPPSENQYLCGWYNAIGYNARTGESFEDLMKYFDDKKSDCTHEEDKDYYDSMVQIVRWLDNNYTLHVRSGS